MKRKILLYYFSILMFLFSFSFSFAQEDSYNFVSKSCAMNSISENDFIFPVKPPVTGENYIRILIVYVMFDGETQESNNPVWPANTTTGPSYKGTMLAQNKNAISDWWNAYNTETQTVSSWFCENSRGQTHVIGNEFFVKLLHNVDYYLTNYGSVQEREKAINAEIYENLTSQGVIWSNFDNWSYNVNTGQYSWGYDHNIDMIYKVHRYKYSNIFSQYAASGYALLGYGSNTNNQYIYDITQNGQVYHILGGFPDPSYSNNDGSGLTVVGNETSGVLSKMGAFSRLMHENGHYFFGCNHSNVGMMGDVWDLSYCPYEKMALGYVTPITSNWENNGFQEVILDDYSARTSNGNFILVVKMPDREFIIANRNKVSYWDRIMNGDVAYFGLDSYHGKGAYIYHNASNHFYYPNQAIDIECADGLWKWVQTGYDAPDWFPSNYVLPVLVRTEAIRNINDDGIGTNINEFQNTVRDGLTIRGEGIPPPNQPIPVLPKYFSKGKKGINGTNSGCGFDRVETNTDWENWTSREFSVDRWDAWKPGYNEIFSPYSSPSTVEWNDQPTGTFIWIKEFSEQTKQLTVRIYRDAIYNSGGMSETDILALTPPSRPMDLKEIQCFYDGNYNRPQITWTHNMEPDMDRIINKQHYKRYNIYKVKSNDMNTVPIETGYQFIKYVDIPINQTPTFIDYSEISACYLPDDASCPPFCWIVYPIRYRVQAVDKDDMVSVKSDFSQLLGMRLENSSLGGNENDGPKGIQNKNNLIPKTFNLLQNYPNPFNPVTNIKYDLPKDIFVSIKIYDLLGKEIKTLVNEQKQAGSYLVSFNGSEFASGVYFYRIQAGDFIQVKRMVLIK
jgi:hypothetical protein